MLHDINTYAYLELLFGLTGGQSKVVDIFPAKKENLERKNLNCPLRAYITLYLKV